MQQRTSETERACFYAFFTHDRGGRWEGGWKTLATRLSEGLDVNKSRGRVHLVVCSLILGETVEIAGQRYFVHGPSFAFPCVLPEC